jgi:type I restriction enzyme S subunit
MTEWQEIELGTVANFSYGKMPKKEKIGMGIFPTFSGYKYQYLYPEYNCEFGELIVVARGVGGTGDVKIVKERCYLTNLSIKIETDRLKVHNKFLYYYYAIEGLRYLDSGSAQSQITITDLAKAIVPLPPLPEQKAIASVLSSLDDKIDLLHRQNKTLEAMAETLFRQWFVEEARDDWEDGKIDDLFILQRGFDLPVQKRIKGPFPIYAASGHAGGHEEYKVKGPGVTTGRSGVLGKVFYIMEDFWPLNTSLFIKEYKIATPLFSYFLLKTIDLEGFNAGSAVPTLNRNHVHGFNISIPPTILIKQFENTVMPCFEKIQFNQNQIRTLEKLRDTLLPKLMSGEVRVEYEH